MLNIFTLVIILLFTDPGARTKYILGRAVNVVTLGSASFTRVSI